MAQVTVFLDQTELSDIGSIATINSINPPTRDFPLRAFIEFDGNSEERFGRLRIRRKSAC